MRLCVVLLTLAISFVAPLAIPAAQASEPNTVQAQASDSSCRRRPRRPKKQSSNKDKKKDSKKPYGFEL